MDDNTHDASGQNPTADPGWGTLFEDRYGIGAQARLLASLRQPCVTFARIAHDFGVTRECVRQWHRRLLPEAPSGHERQRQCRLLGQRRRLFQDQLFASFYRRIRADVPSAQVTLLRSRDGFRRRSVQIGWQLIALTRPALVGQDRSVPSVYRLSGVLPDADLVYCDLGSSGFLLVPRALVDSGTFLAPDGPDSPYAPFRNSCSALAATKASAASPPRPRPTIASWIR